MTPPLDVIGDIANPSLTENAASETITWETATDWDNAVSNYGVVHESTAETDWGDAAVVQKGWGTETLPELASIENLLLMHDSSGPLTDVSGNNRDWPESGGPTYDNAGLGQGTVVSADASDDYWDAPSASWMDTDNVTIAIWWNPNTTYNGGEGRKDLLSRSFGPYFIFDSNGNGEIQCLLYDSGGNGFNVFTTTSTWNSGTWYLIIGSYDTSTLRIEVNGTEEGTNSYSASRDLGETDWFLNRKSFQNESYPGGEYGGLCYWSTVLSSAQKQELYDAYAGESYLTTATKTFSANSKPDLTGLSYSLNGETIIIDVIGSPGTGSEETVSQTLDGSSSYSLTWSSSHTDFRVKPRLDTADLETSPTVSSVSLTS